MSPRERGAGRRRLSVPAALLATALLAAGCGRANLSETTASVAPPSRAHAAPGTHAKPPAPAQDQAVQVPVPLTATVARHFARSVTLFAADLPGARATPRSQAPSAQEREAASCDGHPQPAVGGGSSPNFQRGAGLDRESLSSSVEVLGSAAAVGKDLAYVSSRAGRACYAKVLSNSLRAGEDTNLRLLSVRIGRLAPEIGAGERATGIRIDARVALLGTPVAVRLFIDALSLPYGPTELDLYATSFIEPAPERTEQELLSLLRQRALRDRL